VAGEGIVEGLGVLAAVVAEGPQPRSVIKAAARLSLAVVVQRPSALPSSEYAKRL
jgi:hypothetical protein